MGEEWELQSQNIYCHTNSGLKIYHKKSDSLITRVEVCVRTCVENDYGFPHALEHLVFFGSQKNPFRGFIDQFSINQLCSPINAITSQDHTKFMFSGVKIEKVVARLIEQLLKPFLPEEAFYTEIFDPKSNTGVMFYELCDREFDLKLISPLECRKVLYSNFGSFNCDASGSAANLRNGECQFTAVRNYHEKHYKPFNFGIFVHGNLDLEELQGDLKSVLEHYTLEPKMVEVRDKVKSDSLRIMTLPCPNEDLFLTLSWEIILDDLEATKVLLEFFKKNHSVLFSNFAYEIMILDSDHANVCVTFEDFEELDEEKMAIKMKKSIAEYMNQVGKDSFLECLKSALQLTKVRNQLEDETNPHEKVMRSFTNHFLYHFEEEGQIVENDFTFWYNVTKRWVRENWGVVVINGSQKLYEKEVKSHKFHSKQPTPLPKEDFEVPKSNFEMDQYLNFDIQPSENFTILMFAYEISQFSKEESDFLPMIEVLMTKAIRTVSNVIKIKSIMKKESHFLLLVTVLHEQAEKTLKEILERIFMDECESLLGKVAKAILGNVNNFDLEDVNFWRNFLRFKHYLKLLKSLSNYEEKPTKKTEKILESMLNHLSNVEVHSTEELQKKCQVIIDKQKLKNNAKTAAKSYGYDHHRINVSDEIQSSHACIMMKIPEDVSICEASVIAEILNLSGKGVLWQCIRDQGIAYAASMHLDYNNQEFVLVLHDSGDIIKALSLIRQTMEEFGQMTIKEPLMDLAKKSANFKLLKRNQTHIQRAQNRFIEKILWPSSQNDLIQKIDKISDLEKAQKSVSKDFLNPKKINMVVMIPKDTLTKVQTLKGLLSHGFKLLK